MAATTSNRDALNSDGRIVEYPVASGAHVYAGTIVEIDTRGFIKSATGATNATFVGVAVDEANNTSSNDSITVADGAVASRVEKRGIFQFIANAAPVAADLGKDAEAVDNQTVGVGTSVIGTPVGSIVDYGTTPYNFYRIRIDNDSN